MCAESSGPWDIMASRRLPGAAVLSLDKLCENLQITVRPFAVCSVGQGERLMLGPREEATVHYVVAGHGTLFFPDFSEFPLRERTAIVAPTGSLHEVAGMSDPEQIPSVVRRCQPAELGLAAVGNSPDEVNGGVVMLCGTVDVTYRYLNDFFDYLPAPIIIQPSSDDPLSRSFEEIVREMAAPRPGTDAMLSALFQQCFIELLRRQAGNECAIEWLAALEDPRLSETIDEIIENPGNHYTVDLLAEKCAMSRTTFAERFRQASGPRHRVVAGALTTHDLDERHDVHGIEEVHAHHAFRRRDGLRDRRDR